MQTFFVSQSHPVLKSDAIDSVEWRTAAHLFELYFFPA